MKFENTLDDFTDDEIKDIIKEAVKHYNNPKHSLSQFNGLPTALEVEFLEYKTNIKRNEEVERLWKLYDELYPNNPLFPIMKE